MTTLDLVYEWLRDLPAPEKTYPGDVYKLPWPKGFTINEGVRSMAAKQGWTLASAGPTGVSFAFRVDQCEGDET